MSSRTTRRSRNSKHDNKNTSRSRSRNTRMCTTQRGRQMHMATTIANSNRNNRCCSPSTTSFEHLSQRTPSKTPPLTRLSEQKTKTSETTDHTLSIEHTDELQSVLMNLDNGIDIDNLVTPSSITNEQRGLLKDSIANKYIAQKQLQKEQAAKRAEHARSFINQKNINNTNNAVVDDICTAEQDSTNTHPQTESSNNNIDDDDDDIADESISNCLQAANTNNNIDDDIDNELESKQGEALEKKKKTSKQKSSKQKSSKQKQQDRKKGNHSYFKNLTSTPWYISNNTDQKKKIKSVLLSPKLKAIEKKMKPSNLDNLARGLRTKYFMLLVSMLVARGGSVSQRVSRKALKFCMVVLPFTYFKTIGDLADGQVIGSVVRLFCENGISKNDFKTVNGKKGYYQIKTPLPLMVLIIKLYCGYSTDDEAMHHINNDKYSIQDYANIENKNIPFDWKQYCDVYTKIYECKQVPWTLIYNIDTQKFEQLEINEDHDIEMFSINKNGNNINNILTNNINKKNDKLESDDSDIDTHTTSTNNKQIQKYPSPFVAHDGKPTAQIDHFYSNGALLAVLTAPSISLKGYEFVENRILKINTSISNVSETPNVLNTEYLSSNVVPTVTSRSFLLKVPGTHPLSKKDVIIHRPFYTTLWAFYSNDNSKTNAFYNLQSSVNMVQLPVPDSYRRMRRKGNALRTLMSDDLVFIDKNDLDPEIADAFERYSHQSLNDISKYFDKWINETLKQYDIVKKYLSDDGEIIMRDNFVAMNRPPLLCEPKAFSALHGAFVAISFPDETEDYEPTECLDMCLVFLKPNINGRTKVINLEDSVVYSINICDSLEEGHIYCP